MSSPCVWHLFCTHKSFRAVGVCSVCNVTVTTTWDYSLTIKFSPSLPSHLLYLLISPLWDSDYTRVFYKSFGTIPKRLNLPQEFIPTSHLCYRSHHLLILDSRTALTLCFPSALPPVCLTPVFKPSLCLYIWGILSIHSKSFFQSFMLNNTQHHEITLKYPQLQELTGLFQGNQQRVPVLLLAFWPSGVVNVG